jgi:hypothetical protein
MANVDYLQAAVSLLAVERQPMHARASGGDELESNRFELVNPAPELSRDPIDHTTVCDSRLQSQPRSTLPTAKWGAHR